LIGLGVTRKAEGGQSVAQAHRFPSGSLSRCFEGSAETAKAWLDVVCVGLPSRADVVHGHADPLERPGKPQVGLRRTI
jgi:hypothetical protein